MIACYAVYSHPAVVNVFMKRLRTCKNIVHAWDSAWMMNRGDAGVRDVIVHSMVEKRVFNTQFVTGKNMKQIFTSGVTSRNTMRSKNLHMFLTSARTYSRVDVTANDNCRIHIYGV